MPMNIYRRRDFISTLALGSATLAMTPAADPADSAPSKRRRSASGLAAPVFRPLPLGSITAGGWLQRQLRIQAQGLTGHLDEFWPDVADSQWFGGKADGWERAPYWLDGFIPLAWSLDDSALREKARRRVEQIIRLQRPDGSFAPFPADPAKRYDHWSVLLVDKALAQYHDATGDERVLQAILANLKSLLAVLERAPLFDWGRHRWYEGLISVYYAYEKTGAPWLLELAGKLRAQGKDFMALFSGDDITVPTPRRGRWTWDKHVVNTGMALKAYGLSWRLTGDPKELEFPARMLAVLDRYHGQVTGMFSGDECLAGTSPTQGTELCAVVEAMFSFEQLLAVTGQPAWGDRLERVAFNALPATYAPDMWSHQYVQQVNQVQCTINPESMWGTNGPDANLFGLEPNFGCCTSNMHQGWPKFAAHLWMSTADQGIAAVSYAPSTVRFQPRGTPVSITLETDYPFRETLRFVVQVERPVRFPLWLRVPGWAEGATVAVHDGAVKVVKSGAFHRLDREWKGTTEVMLRLPMRVKTSVRYNRAVAVERGPLVFSLKLGETRTRVNADKPHRELPHGDFEIRPSSPWNYGLLINEANPATSFVFEERPVGEMPFSPEGAGITARAKGRRLPNWKIQHGWAEEVPTEPQTSSEPLEEVTLIPYGCTNIRVTEFPRLKG